MQVYIHWLDSEYIATAVRAGTKAFHHRATAERTIKAFALLGVDLVLGDMQILESLPILDLFKDEAFYKGFLAVSPTFLQVGADAEGVKGQLKAFHIATSGYRRCLKPGWQSSLFRQPHNLQRIAEIVTKEENDIDEDMLRDEAKGSVGAIIGAAGADKDNLKAAFLAVLHFARHRDATLHRVPRSTMYNILEEVLGSRHLNGDDRAIVLRTKEFIEKTHKDKEENFGFRSPVIRALDGLPPEQALPIRGTVVHAWNRAVQNTLRAQIGSLSDLRGAAPASLFLDRPIEAYSWHSVSKNPLFARFSWDPMALNWSQIAELVRKTERTRTAYQAAMKSGDNVTLDEARTSHLRMLATELASTFPAGPTVIWSLGPVAALIGHPHVAAALGSPRVGYELIRHSKLLLKQKSIVNTLAGLADRVEPTQGS